MKSNTPIIVILVITLSIMVMKVANNHQRIQMAKEKLNAQPLVPISPMDETNTSQTKADETKNTTQKQWTQAINTNSPDHTKVKQIQAKPDEPLEEGFEWTDEYYDPDRIGEPGYREKVMKHLHAKHYYESPQRQMPPFKESRALLKQWKVEPSMENIVLVHDTAVEWHRNLYYAERESGPAAGPETRERVDFMTEFKKKSIRGRFDDIFGIKDNAFMEALVEIKPDRPILGPKLKIEPGQRLMKQTN